MSLERFFINGESQNKECFLVDIRYNQLDQQLTLKYCFGGKNITLL